MIDVDVVIAIVTALVTIGLVIMAVLLLALIVPVFASGRIDGLDLSETDGINDANTTWAVKGGWMWGLIQFTMKGTGITGGTKRISLLGFNFNLAGDKKSPRSSGNSARRSTPKDKSEKRRPKKKRRRSNPFRWEDVGPLLSELRWLTPRLFKTLRFRGEGKLVYGFPDPFMTGMSQAVLGVTPWPRHLVLIPAFDEGQLRGDLSGSITIYPIASLFLLLRFVLRPTIRHILWRQLKSWWPLRKNTRAATT